MKGLITALKRAFGALVALIVLFEEWGWEPLQRLMARIGRWPLVRQVEAVIVRLPPWAALIVLGLPSLLLVPVKLAALWLIGWGHGTLGVVVIVVAKMVGTAIVARLFALTRPALMRITWFEVIYARWVVWKDSRDHARACVVGMAGRARVQARVRWHAMARASDAVRFEPPSRSVRSTRVSSLDSGHWPFKPPATRAPGHAIPPGQPARRHRMRQPPGQPAQTARAETA